MTFKKYIEWNRNLNNIKKKIKKVLDWKTLTEYCNMVFLYSPFGEEDMSATRIQVSSSKHELSFSNDTDNNRILEVLVVIMSSGHMRVELRSINKSDNSMVTKSISFINIISKNGLNEQEKVDDDLLEDIIVLITNSILYTIRRYLRGWK